MVRAVQRGTGTGDFDFYAIDAGVGESITINAEKC